LCAAVISGVAVFVNSYGVKAFGDATAYTTAKNLIAALLLIVVTGIGRAQRRIEVTVPGRSSQLLGLGVIGLIGGSVPFVLFFEGLAHIASGPVQAQFINKTLVIWVAMLAVSVLGERLGVLQLAAVVLLVIGQAVLSGGLTSLSRMSFGSGEVLIFAATLLWAVEVVVAKRLMAGLNSWTVALARMVLGSVLLVGWVMVSGRGERLVRMDAHQWAWVLLTGALLAGYVATWLAALAVAPAVSVTAVLVAAVPITAVLQELVTHSARRPQLAGLTLVVLGCAVAAATMLPVRARRRAQVAG